MVSEVEIEVEPEVEINIADILVSADVVIDDIEVDTGIEITAIDDVIEKVITPNEGAIVVSPAGQLYATTNFN